MTTRLLPPPRMDADQRAALVERTARLEGITHDEAVRQVAELEAEAEKQREEGNTKAPIGTSRLPPKEVRHP